MRKIHVLGAVDKSFILLAIAKIMNAMGKRLLLIDDTRQSQYRGCVPAISFNDQFIEYEGFDVLIGCKSWEEASRLAGDSMSTYEFVIIDSDHPGCVHNWGLSDRYTLFLNFERMTTILNKEILTSLFIEGVEIYMSRVIFPFVQCKINEQYLRGEYEAFPINWEDPSYEIDLDETEYALKVTNQYESRIHLKGLSRHTRTVLADLVSEWSSLDIKDVKLGMKKALRQLSYFSKGGQSR